MGKREIEGETGNEGVGAAAAGWRIAVLVSCLTASACGGRALVGSLSCGDSDSGGRSSDASGAPACAPVPCPIIGDAWQLSGGEYMCTNGTCTQVVPPCTQGAIRFDPSGTLFRLTSAGWESACAFATCGDRVTGALLRAYSPRTIPRYRVSRRAPADPTGTSSSSARISMPAPRVSMPSTHRAFHRPAPSTRTRSARAERGGATVCRSSSRGRSKWPTAAARRDETRCGAPASAPFSRR